MTTTLQIRIHPKTKKAAQQILGKLGLNLSSAINMYLMQVVIRKGVPFELLTENGMTPQEERKILKEMDWAKKHGKRYSSTQEMFRDILND